MSLPRELLAQALELSQREGQANLRRSISAAYYALFHLLIHEACEILISLPAIRAKVSRAFDHGDMKAASRMFAKENPDLSILTGGLPIPTELREVALSFAALQEARHEADYNVEVEYTPAEARAIVLQAQTAFEFWETTRSDPSAQAYLAALLLWKRWNRS